MKMSFYYNRCSLYPSIVHYYSSLQSFAQWQEFFQFGDYALLLGEGQRKQQPLKSSQTFVLVISRQEKAGFSLAFCLRRTGGDRFGCRIVASYLGMKPGIFARNTSKNAVGSTFATRYHVSYLILRFSNRILDFSQLFFSFFSLNLFFNNRIDNVFYRRILINTFFFCILMNTLA